jgi:Holliday junction resolvasome RuvABC ATP-dependent DNA helicase subunit
MKKQAKQQEIIDLDTFSDVSLFQLIPSGRGMGQSLLKTYVDSVHNGSARLKSILISGKEGLSTTGVAFIKAFGITRYNQIDGSLLHNCGELNMFFCGGNYEAYLISNIETIPSTVQLSIYHVLAKQEFYLYNYMQGMYDTFYVPGLVVLTSQNVKNVAKPITDRVNHIVPLEDFTPEQLELIILQRLKYARIEYEDCILKDIVKYGSNTLRLSISFLMCCISVMQSDGRGKLTREDVQKAARLTRLQGLRFGEDIPF